MRPRKMIAPKLVNPLPVLTRFQCCLQAFLPREDAEFLALQSKEAMIMVILDVQIKMRYFQESNNVSSLLQELLELMTRLLILNEVQRSAHYHPRPEMKPDNAPQTS